MKLLQITKYWFYLVNKAWFIYIFCKAYAIKEKVENKLERLVKEDIFELLEYSEWAKPVVPFYI